MRKLLVEPFQESTPTGRKAIALMMLLQTLMATNYNVIPLIFYRPRFYCTDGAGVIQCNELDACEKKPVLYRSDFGFSSISQEFEFYCDHKKDEATILTFMMLGHLIGALASTLMSDMGHRKGSLLNLLIVNCFVTAVCCFMGGMAHTPFVVGLALAVWSFSAEMILNFLNMMPTLYFSTEKSKTVFSLLVISWSLYSLFVPAMVYIHLSWRILLVINVGLPHALWALYAWYSREELVNQVTQDATSQQLLTAEEQRASQSTPIATFRDIMNSSHYRNILLYFLIFGGSYVSQITSFLTMGALSGNVYINLTVLCSLEITLSLIGGYLIHCLEVKTTLRSIFLLIAVSYCAYSLLPSLLQQFVVMEGKLLNDITWVMLGTFTIEIVPARFMPLVMSARAIYNIGVSIILPYVKYFLELARLTIFVFSGAYEVCALFALRTIQTKDLSVP